VPARCFQTGLKDTMNNPMLNMQTDVWQWAANRGYSSPGGLGGPREAPYAGQDITPRGEKFFFVKFGKPSLFEASVRIFHPSVVQIRSWQPGELCRWEVWQFAPPKKPVWATKDAKDIKDLVRRNRNKPIPWEDLRSSLEKLEPHYVGLSLGVIGT